MNSSNHSKIYAVTGATGKVGSVVARELRTLGHQVRSVCRQSGIAYEDGGALADAFRGADGVFLMLPPEITADDLRQRQNELGDMVLEALQRVEVRRVVFLSSLDWRRASDARPVLALRDLEDRLDLSGIPERVYLRPGYFMENLLKSIPGIQKAGMFGGALSPEVPVPMIAARDIAAVAVKALLEEPFSENCIRDLLGPRDRTMAEAASLLGAAIGRPELRYVQSGYEQTKDRMIQAGTSASYAQAIMEIVRSFNERRDDRRTARSEKNTTFTSLETFINDTFLPAFEAIKAA